MVKLIEKPHLSKAAAKRLSLYLRCLNELNTAGVTKIRSSEFSRLTQVGSATIRRDFSQVGELGRSGYGYDVAYLIKVFNELLDVHDEKRIALIGCGNLGQALLKNNFRRNANLNIICAFDNDPEKIGREVAGQIIQPLENLPQLVAQENISVAISTVPSQFSQAAVNAIVKSGLTAILNFAPDPVDVPPTVNVHYIDLTTELQTLIYFDEQSE